MYLIAWLQHDEQTMRTEQRWFDARPRLPGGFSIRAEVLASEGKLAAAHELVTEALQAVRGTELAGRGEAIRAHFALTEAAVGKCSGPSEFSADLAEKPLNRHTAPAYILALALCGDTRSATAAANNLAQHFAEDTILNSIDLAAIRAAVALAEHDTSRAIGTLKVSQPYELGLGGVTAPLMPAYLRGVALLQARRGAEAVDEFRKILEHPGIAPASILGPLARLGVGRAYVLTGDKEKARTAYQDFLAQWKDADPDLAVLKQAKAEYAKLE